MKNQKGITLIALVITIIVLLILAAVSIAMLTGENGILTKANDSRKETNAGTAVEKINMELNALKAEYLSADSKTDFTYTATATIESNLGLDSDKKDSAGITYAVTGGGTTAVSITATLPDGRSVTGSINATGVISPASKPAN